MRSCFRFLCQAGNTAGTLRHILNNPRHLIGLFQLILNGFTAPVRNTLHIIHITAHRHRTVFNGCQSGTDIRDHFIKRIAQLTHFIAAVEAYFLRQITTGNITGCGRKSLNGVTD